MHVRDMTIGPASTAEVTEFCRRYHYTNTGGTMNWRYGLYHEGTLLGVVAYNLPTRRTCEAVFGKDHFDKVWHMGRLALADVAPRNSESRLIAGSIKRIQEEHPHVWGILTYAATDVGHVGYVYQATNAIYTGTGGSSIYYTDAGDTRRSNYLDGRIVTKARALELGWASHKSSPKHRYLYVLGNKAERKQRMEMVSYPSLPYPKALTPHLTTQETMVRSDKRSIRNQERRQWVRDFLDEATHEDPVYPPGYDHYPEGGNAWSENLSGIPRVTYIPA